MRKQRPIRTGTHKGAQGLTPEEAHARALKAWRTKREHGLFAHPDRPYYRPEAAGDEEETDGAPLALDEDSPELPTDEQVEYRRRPDARTASKFFGDEEVTSGRINVQSLAQRRLWEAQEFVSGGDISEEYKELLTAKGLSPSEKQERDAFLFAVEREKRRRAGQKGEQDPMLARSERAAVDSHARKIETVHRNALHSVINKDPTVRGELPVYSKQKGVSEEFIDPETGRHELLPVQTGRKKATPEEIRQRAIRVATEAFVSPDPILAKTEGITEGRAQADPKKVKAWVDYVVRSHSAPTEAERAINQRRAENLANQLVQTASKRSIARHEAYELAKQDKLIRSAGQAAVLNAEAEGEEGSDIVPRNVASQQIELYQAGSQDIINKESERVELLRRERLLREKGEYNVPLTRGQIRENRMYEAIGWEGPHKPRIVSPSARQKSRALTDLKKKQNQLAKEVKFHNEELRRWSDIRKDETEAERAARVDRIAKARERVFSDPRLADTTTAEQLYALYGHETAKPFARSRYEFRRAVDKIRGDEPESRTITGDKVSEGARSLIDLQNRARELGVDPSGIPKRKLAAVIEHAESDAPKWFARARAQTAFNKGQYTSKLHSLREGNLTVGVDNKGQVTKPDEAVFRFSPNRKYRYEIRDRTNPLGSSTQEVPIWDKNEKLFKGGSVDFITGEEKVPSEILSVDQVWRQRSPVFSEVDDRVRRGGRKSDLGPEYSREVFVPIKGTRESSTTIPDPTATREVRQIREARSPGSPGKAAISPGPPAPNLRAVKWTDVDPTDAKSQAIWEATAPEDRRTTRVPKKLKVTTIDPSELELGSKSRINVGAVVPHNKNQFGNIAEVNLAGLESRTGIALSDAFLKLHDAKEERILRQRSSERVSKPLDRAISNLDTEHELLRQQWERDPRWGADLDREKSERGYKRHRAKLIGELGAAAATSAYYTSQERVKKGYVPNFINQQYGKFQESHPATAIKLRDWGMDKKLDVNQAFIQPGVHNIANFRWRAKHPFSSESGTTLGIDWGTTINKEGPVSKFIPNFIPGFRPKDQHLREIRRLSDSIETIHNTETLINKHAYKTDIKSKFIQHRVDPFTRWDKYKHFYDQAAEPAGHTYDVTTGRWIAIPGDHSDGLLATATKRAREIRNSVAPGTDVYRKANELEDKAYQLRQEHFARNQPPSLTSPFKAIPNHLALVPWTGPPSRFSRWSQGDFSHTERNLAIAGGVGAAALGGAYLYHRHLEKKRHEADANYEGTRFYNDIIPGPIDVPWVHLRSTAHYRIPDNNVTREFSLANKRAPIQFGARIQRKNIWKGSPEDRGYDPNAKVIGHLGNEKPSGSFLQSAFFNASAPRKRSWVPAGGQLVVAGHKLPIKAEIGKFQKTKLTSTNPNRLKQEDRDNILWAFAGSAQEPLVREFFSYGKRDKLIDMFDDPEERTRVNRQKGTREIREIRKRAAAPNVTVRIREGDNVRDVTMPRFGFPQAAVRYDSTPPETYGTYPEIPYSETAAARQTPEEYFQYLQRRDQRTSAEREAEAAARPTTGGTAGSHPYSQVGQEVDPRTGRRMKYETVFNEATGEAYLQKRPVGSRKTSAEEFLASDEAITRGSRRKNPRPRGE